MILNIEREYDLQLPFDINDMALKVLDYCVKWSKIKYEVSITLTTVNNEQIREFNNTYRQIDRETDVLSFPAISYEEPGVFPDVESHKEDYFDPENDSLYLGDIVLSLDKVISQAEEYGHSQLREFSFLLTHSFLHLMGYDHMVSGDEAVMIEKQKIILNKLEIKR